MSRNMARPLVITMDAFGTLFTPKEAIEKQYCKVAREYGLMTRETDIKATFKQAFKSLSAQHPNYGAGSGMHPRAWWSSVIQETFTPLVPANQGLPEQLVPALYARFSSSDGYRLFDDVLPFLRRVQNAGGRESEWKPPCTVLGVVSNSDPRVKSILASFGINFAIAAYPGGAKAKEVRNSDDIASFSFAALSYEVGEQKPSAKIYDAARGIFASEVLKSLQATDDGEDLPRSADDFQFLHVGDDVENDIIPALESGWRAVLIDRKNTTKSDELRDLVDSGRVRIVKNLEEINSII